MDNYNVLVLMEKDKETGFLTNTIDSYMINYDMEFIENTYLMLEDEESYVYLTLTTKDIEDFEYYGIYDQYNEDIYSPYGIDIIDGSGEYFPRWIIRLPYNENRKEMEKFLNKLIATHINELERILPLVKNEKEKYIAEMQNEEPN